VSRDSPSFDLVVATVGRTDELRILLDSLEAQHYPQLRAIVVDQNDDERVPALLEGRQLAIDHLRSAPGLSRARNVGLQEVSADLVAFPDDDCTYPPGLLERVAERFRAEPRLDGLTGRAEDERGRSSASWKDDAALLTRDNLWNRANAATTFLRRELVQRVGEFDESLGLGSGRRSSSGEETDYLVRAVGAGARIAYDPSLVVRHDVREDDSVVGLRDGTSLGYLLRKHGYPPRTVARMLVRPAGGALIALARLDVPRARYYAASLRGRVEGYVGARRSNSSA
jgi:glycosyltransferase involved in cell wall biosynthesis